MFLVFKYKKRTHEQLNTKNNKARIRNFDIKLKIKKECLMVHRATKISK